MPLSDADLARAREIAAAAPPVSAELLATLRTLLSPATVPASPDEPTEPRSGTADAA